MGGTPYRDIVVVLFGLVIHEVRVTVVKYSHVSLKWVQTSLRKASKSAQVNGASVLYLAGTWFAPLS